MARLLDTFVPKYGAAARSTEKNTGAPKEDVTGYSCSKLKESRVKNPKVEPREF